MAGNAVVERFIREGEPAVRGFLHHPTDPSGDGLVLTHGAGGNCQSPLLVSLAEAFADAGYLVLRCDLPFRQSRAFGSPRPGDASLDRKGIIRAVDAMRTLSQGKLYLGGQSYGGRQSTMLAAEQPDLANGLLLLSYPLHPPGKPEELRTTHFPKLRTPALFVHGSRDPFASSEEITSAVQLIPARTKLLEIAGGAHDLKVGRKADPELPSKILQEFQAFFASAMQA